MIHIDPREIENATQNRYEILSQIGQGAMGAVFLARDKELGSHVAIKVLPPDVRSSPDRLARFRREARLTAQLSHPNLVSAFEFNVDGDVAYLVMPYIDGIPLDTHLAENGTMSYDEVRTLISHVGSALAFAHNRGIVHRDIKPANILLEKATGRWLVTDFGVAHVATDTALTRTGATVGTPAYMAPEQLGGAADVDARADLFSLAAVAFEALMGNRAEPTAGVDRLTAALLAERPELSPSFARTLAQPLATSRDERPASVQDWLDELGDTTSQSRRNVWVGAAVALLAAWAAWQILPEREGSPASSDTPSVLAVFPFGVTGTGATAALDSLLPQAMTMELQTLPNLRVLQPAEARARVLRRFGGGSHPLDSLLSAAADLGADRALVGTAETSDEEFRITVDLYDVATKDRIGGATRTAPPDSIHRMVSELVIDAVARRIASERSGTPHPTLPSAWPAVQAFLRGDAAFRRGAFEEANENFNRVIALDSSFAMAYFKRMLATIFMVQPTKTGPAIRSALVMASGHRDGLDPVYGGLLEGYETLLRTGDVTAAERRLDSLTREYPDAVDAWFLLGILRFRFGSALNATIPEAKWAFQQALARDPTFAPAIGQLIQIAILENDRKTAQRYMSLYIELDRTSLWADLIGMVDTLLFRRQHAPAVLRTFPTRPKRALENIALAAGELRQPPGTHAFAVAAIDALAARAETPVEFAVTFRMRMATLMATGQVDAARDYLAAARGRGVPQEEIDRWVVLTATVAAPALRGPAATADAARRLEEAQDEPFVSAWLAARWARRAGQTGLGDERLRQLTPQPADRTPVEQSLLDDLAALDQLAAGDTAAALATWRTATSRYSIEDVVFGLVNSLWPLRLDQMRVALAAGRLPDALAVARTFDRMAGFVDQTCWMAVLATKAEIAFALGDQNLAVNAYDDMYRIAGFAGGAGAATRDSIARIVGTLRN